MVKYWIIPTTEKNWEVIRENNIIGVPAKSAAKNLISKGDIIILYITKKKATRYGGKFVGAYRVVSDWYHEEKPLWPDEVSEGAVKYPWRAKIEPIKSGLADFKELASKLKFIVKKNKVMAYLIGTPANFRRPIPEDDAKLILNSMK